MEDGAAASGSRGAMTRRAVLQLLAAAPIAALVPWRPPPLTLVDWARQIGAAEAAVRIVDLLNTPLPPVYWRETAALTEIARGSPANGLTDQEYAQQVLALFKSRQHAPGAQL